MFDLSMDDKEFRRKIKELIAKSPEALTKAMEIAGIQFLSWANDGSPRNPAKPPVRRGFLRGSSSVFLGGKLVGVNEGQDNKDANRSYSEEDFVLTWGWNSPYATRMHETEYNPGPISKLDTDAGNKWLEKHIDSDRDALLEVISKEFSKRLGTA